MSIEALIGKKHPYFLKPFINETGQVVIGIWDHRLPGVPVDYRADSTEAFYEVVRLNSEELGHGQKQPVRLIGDSVCKRLEDNGVRSMDIPQQVQRRHGTATLSR